MSVISSACQVLARRQELAISTVDDADCIAILAMRNNAADM